MQSDDGSVQMVGQFAEAPPLAVEQISSTHFTIEAGWRWRHWFMFKLEGVAGKIVRIDLTDVDHSRWGTLNPVYTYAADLNDPRIYATSKPGWSFQGSADAWNGSTLPKTDGQSWHFIKNAWNSGKNTFSMVERFEHDSVWVAMKYPYPVEYFAAYTSDLEPSDHADVIQIGKSAGGRPLYVIQIGDGDPRDKPGVVIYAGDHADEYDAPWVAQGAIDFLISDAPEAHRLRQKLTFLIIPMLDPDGSAAGEHSAQNLRRLPDGGVEVTWTGVGSTFEASRLTPEARAFMGFFESWVESGRPVDVVLNLHNVESKEGPHVFGVELTSAIPSHTAEAQALYREVVTQVSAAGYDARQGFTYTVDTSDRLDGWLGSRTGATRMLLEVNSQAPARHLTLDELQGIGRPLLIAANNYLDSRVENMLNRQATR